MPKNRADSFAEEIQGAFPENKDGDGQREKQGGDESEGMDGGALTASNRRGVIHCLTVIGQIEGHILLPPDSKTTKYEHVIPQLAAAELRDDIDGLLILLNTAGGDVEAGLAIAELIASMKKPTVSLVLGGGHSIGVPLAVAAKRSFIASTATMTIHPIRMTGPLIGVPQTLNYFKRMQERIIDFVVGNSGMDRETFCRFCFDTQELANDVGRVITGREAVASGLIDELGGLDRAMDCLYSMIERRRRGKQ